MSRKVNGAHGILHGMYRPGFSARLRRLAVSSPTVPEGVAR